MHYRVKGDFWLSNRPLSFATFTESAEIECTANVQSVRFRVEWIRVEKKIKYQPQNFRGCTIFEDEIQFLPVHIVKNWIKYILAGVV